MNNLVFHFESRIKNSLMCKIGPVPKYFWAHNRNTHSASGKNILGLGNIFTRKKVRFYHLTFRQNVIPNEFFNEELYKHVFSMGIRIGGML